ncbi:MAG: 30S ribosomal protein S9 [Sulfurovum sp.]
MATIYATGKRKAAIAKVWMTPGNGEMLINGKTLDQWLGGHETLKMKVRLPLEITKQLDNMNIKATTLGGGYSAQADALKHGITKALVEFEPSFRAILKPMGLLTRDSRVVERKKPGKKKARKSPQFSKR